ncbi:MAG: helix-turn-helix domain-containing protein [Acidimicrobiales bacterium]
MSEHAAIGRPRDASIDAAALRVAAEHLGRHGFEAMSLAAVAAEAGTTRQALYRRWPTKADLAVAAIAALPDASPQPLSGDHEADLRAELAAFRRGVTRPGGVSLVGAMLQDGADPELRERYRALRRGASPARLRAIMRGGRGRHPRPRRSTSSCGELHRQLYALALAGVGCRADWPRRAAPARVRRRGRATAERIDRASSGSRRPMEVP